MNVTKIGADGVQGAETAVPDTQALATLSDTAVARPQGSGLMADGGFSGCGGIDLKPAFLDIAYSVSPWNENDKFGNGSFVLDREDQIAKQGTPVVAIVLGARRYWQTYPAKGMTRSDMKFWPDKAAAARDGMIVDMPQKGSGLPLPNAIEACDLSLLVKRPEGVTSTRFVMKLGDSWYAPAKFTANKLWREINTNLFRVALFDASQHNVDPDQGRLDRYFVKFWTTSKKSPTGNTIVNLNFGFDTDANGPKTVPTEVIESLKRLAGLAKEASVGPADDVVDIGADSEPPVATLDL